MAGPGPWSVKGIDPKARAAAKQAAQRQGVTLGEWLSNKMLEAEADFGGQNNTAPANTLQYDPSRLDPNVIPAPSLTHTLSAPGVSTWGQTPSNADTPLSLDIEKLTRRIEANEQRSTLAITGIDQSVLGLLARLEGMETAQSDVAERLVKSFETLDVRLNQSDQDAKEFALQFSRSLKDVSRRIDTMNQQSDTGLSALRHEVGKDVELINNRSDEISQRLSQAEKQTDNALRTLEASFVSVHDKLQENERVLHTNSDNGLSEKFDQKFAMISNELVKIVAETRGQLAAQIETQAANPRLEQMEVGLEQFRQKFTDTEKRHANTLEQIAGAVAHLGEAVEGRLQDTQTQSEERLNQLQEEQANALEKVGQSMADVAARLEAKFEEREQAEQTKAAEDDLEARLRAAETRTGELVEEAMLRVHQRLDDALEQGNGDVSPVQRSLNNLTERLAALETQDVTPTDAAPMDIAPVAEPLDIAPAFEQEPLPELDAEPFEPPAATLDTFPDEGELIVPPAPAPEEIGELSSFNEPSLPPLSGAIDEQALGMPPAYTPEPSVPPQYEPAQYKAEQNEPAQYEAPQYQPPQNEAPQNSAPPAYENHLPYPEPDAPGTIGATADRNFMAAARRSVLETINKKKRPVYPAGPPAPGQTSAAGTKENNRRLLVAVSVFALVAIGGALGLTLINFGGKKPDPVLAQSQAQYVPATNPTNQIAAPAKQAAPAEVPAQSAAQDVPNPSVQQPVQITNLDVQDISPVAAPKPAPAPKPVAPKTARNTDYDAPYQPPKSGPAPKPVSAPRLPIQMAAIPAPSSPNAPIALGRNIRSQTIRPSIEQAAQSGDPVAQYQYAGSLVDSGQSAEAAKIMTRAAERGLPAAQYQLAKYYENGTGVAVNETEARRWTERAANGGNRRAMHNLAMFYAEGRITAQSYENAAKWFEEAAVLGLANSQFNLALLYEQGLGVPKSLPDAYAWYAIAAKSGDKGAENKLGELQSKLPAEALTKAELITKRFRPRPLDLAANGVFRNINWARPQSGDPTAISRAQVLLARLGYTPGPADGQAGEATRLAVVSYERDNGLAQTGHIDAALLSQLERAAVN